MKPTIRISTWLLLFFAAFHHKATSQICTGSLGDPVVNITFGAGSNPGPPLPQGVVTYTYTTLACPVDGYYTIVNNTAGCFSDTWHTLTQDHTPNDAGGFMMLVNASFDPGVFYVDTVKGLCGGTTYEFAAWVVNMLRPLSCQGRGVPPNLKFTIETTTGAVLGSYETGDIAATNSATWNQFGLFFKTPPGVNDVVLRISNRNPGGCGNDLAIDDITFRPCGPKVSSNFPGSDSTNFNVCDGNTSSINLSATVSSGFVSPVYQWQSSTNNGLSWTDIPGANTLQYARPFTGVGVYQYRMAVAESGNMGFQNCRIASNAMTVTVHATPGQSIGSNSPQCEGQTLSLTAATGTRFSWTGPNNFAASGAVVQLPATAAAAGVYTVVATNDVGCSGTNTTQVQVNTRPQVETPPTVSTCENTPLQLTASGASSYRWFIFPDTTVVGNNATVSLLLPVAATPYQIVAIGSTVFNCFDTTLTTVTVSAKPQVNAGPDRYVFEGDSTLLLGSAIGANARLYWQPGTYMNNTTLLQPMVAPPVNFTYELVAESLDGCGTATDVVQVFVYKNVNIPNAFSPNSDGINDTWEIKALDSYPGCRVKLFDRYGKIVLNSTNYSTPWDGTLNGRPLPGGVYYYIIDLNTDNRLIKGSVTLIR